MTENKEQKHRKKNNETHYEIYGVTKKYKKGRQTWKVTKNARNR